MGSDQSNESERAQRQGSPSTALFDGALAGAAAAALAGGGAARGDGAGRGGSGSDTACTSRAGASAPCGRSLPKALERGRSSSASRRSVHWPTSTAARLVAVSVTTTVKVVLGSMPWSSARVGGRAFLG